MVDHVEPGLVYRIVGGKLFQPKEQIAPGRWRDENGKVEHVSFFSRQANEKEVEEFEAMSIAERLAG